MRAIGGVAPVFPAAGEVTGETLQRPLIRREDYRRESISAIVPFDKNSYVRAAVPGVFRD
jgi:hypothetical protein